jgi:hypothetical protein
MAQGICFLLSVLLLAGSPLLAQGPPPTAKVGRPEIVAMTAVGNERSRRVMERLGMRRNPADDFDHPNIVGGHRLRRHVLYRLTAREWAAGHS